MNSKYTLYIKKKKLSIRFCGSTESIHVLLIDISRWMLFWSKAKYYISNIDVIKTKERSNDQDRASQFARIQKMYQKVKCYMSFDKEKTKRSGSWYQLDICWRNIQSPQFFETRTRELQHFRFGIEETDTLSAESIDCRASIKRTRRETRKNRVRRPGFEIDTRFYVASNSN